MRGFFLWVVVEKGLRGRVLVVFLSANGGVVRDEG